MKKYYLHIASKCTVYADDRGVMLGDLAAAHRCAVSVIRNCMRGDTEKQDWRGWHVKIADDCHSACNFDPLSRGIGVQN